MTMLLRLSIILAALFAAGAAQAQSPCTYIAYGAVLTPGQWNDCFQVKQDYLGAPPLLTTGGTLSGLLITAPSTTVGAGFNLPPGVAPTVPNNGDLWSTNSGLFARINGATIELTGAGSGSFTASAPLAVTFPSPGVVNYALSYNGTLTTGAGQLGLNLANANTWTGTQTFGNGTTSALFTGGPTGFGTGTPYSWATTTTQGPTALVSNLDGVFPTLTIAQSSATGGFIGANGISTFDAEVDYVATFWLSGRSGGHYWWNMCSATAVCTTPLMKLTSTGGLLTQGGLAVAGGGTSGATATVNGDLNLPGSFYLTFGATDGTSGYGFWNNGGTIDLKNSGGSWNPIVSANVGTPLATGANSVTNLTSANTGFDNVFSVFNSGTASNGSTLATLQASLSALSGGYLNVAVNGGSSPFAAITSGVGLTGGMTLTTNASSISNNSATGVTFFTGPTSFVGAQAVSGSNLVTLFANSGNSQQGLITNSGALYLATANGAHSATVSAAGLLTAESLAVNTTTVPPVGIYAPGTNVLGFATNSVERASIDANGNVYGATTSSWLLRNVTPSATVPTLVPNSSDTTTGIGSAATGTMTLIGGGVEQIDITAGGIALPNTTLATCANGLALSSANVVIKTSCPGSVVTVGTTAVSGGTSGYLLYNNAGALGNESVATALSGVTLIGGINLGGQTLSGNATFSGNSTFANLSIKGSSSGTTALVSANASATNYTVTLPAATMTVAALNLAGQSLSGGVLNTPSANGTMSSGTFTPNCGNEFQQTVTNNGAFTWAAPTNDGACTIEVTNGSSAGTITFSGYSVNASYTGAALDNVSGHMFKVAIDRLNGHSTYYVIPEQ